MTTVQRSHADEVLSGLKDFQRRTVEWVFERLYDPAGSGRFLVADEVGLGKTMVARGVVAKAIDHLRGKVDRTDVLYICSNGDIARQNIQRLKLANDEHFALASRLTMLPLELARLRGAKTGVNFVSFTPATSFDLRDGLGDVHERVLLYWMLRSAWGLGDDAASKNVFQGNVGVVRFRELVGRFEPERIDGGAQQAFTAALAGAKTDGRETSRTRFDRLREAYSRSDRSIDAPTKTERSRFIGELRQVLAMCCVASLEPDLVILDEFQRFSHLLDAADDASNLARAVFDYPNVRVLLLSATPYKMYTLPDEGGGDDHYRDFVRTIRFLEGKVATPRPIEEDLEAYAGSLVGLSQAEGAAAASSVKARLAERLRRVMVRTERLASTPDRNGMLQEVPAASLPLCEDDVRDYLALQAVGRLIGHGDTTEYWKSSPYVLNFLDDGYKLKTELRKKLEVGETRMAVAKALAASSTSTLRWDDLHEYSAVDPGNARMRALVHDVLDAGAHRLLWIPPSMPYYKLGGPYAEPRLARFTKRLVFSSWRVVPRAIAAITSYEVERRLFGGGKGAEYTTDYRRKQGNLLRTAKTDRRLTGMSVLALLYPSLYLAEACDPARLAAELAVEGGCSAREISAERVLDSARERIQIALDLRLPAARADGPVDERWYWAAPLLLDHKLHEAATRAWFAQPDLAEAWSVDSSVGEDGTSATEAWAEHVAEARMVAEEGHVAATAGGRGALGRRPDDLVDVLAHLALGGPAVAMFRALLHVVGGEAQLDERGRIALRNGAGRSAWAFISLFNQPEIAALLHGRSDARGQEAYWRRVLAYGVDGCIQAVLDEYVHVLRDHLGLKVGTIAERVHEIAAEVVDAVQLRTSRVTIDDLARTEAGRTITRSSKNIRTHFALRYGDEKAEDGTLMTRADQVRKAFNSPFWPFVLATTSVGQEGLDFHTYCHAVVHWNVPSNPVDFEQREGRVHRYKGHAVRKNVAETHGDEVLRAEVRDRWEAMFASACRTRAPDDSDVVPFWIYSKGTARIERHVPALPLSRDRQRAQRLSASLALYRMVFGQPRQQDLLAYLLEEVPHERLATLMDELRIDLGPPVPEQHD